MELLEKPTDAAASVSMVELERIVKLQRAWHTLAREAHDLYTKRMDIYDRIHGVQNIQFYLVFLRGGAFFLGMISFDIVVLKGHAVAPFDALVVLLVLVTQFFFHLCSRRFKYLDEQQEALSDKWDEVSLQRYKMETQIPPFARL